MITYILDILIEGRYVGRKNSRVEELMMAEKDNQV